MHWDNDGRGAGWALFMVLMMVLFWGTIVALVVMALRGGWQRGGPPPAQPDPRGILDQRLAKGEIDAAAYREARELLGDKR